MKRVFGLAFVLMALGACASAPRQVLTQTNAFYYWRGEYERVCPKPPAPPTTPTCISWAKDLNALEDRVHDAEAAVKRGGALPLQLKALKRAAKAAAR